MFPALGVLQAPTKARTTGTSINARWTEGGLTVRQTLNMERHYDA
jgi:hypothetical protein